MNDQGLLAKLLKEAKAQAAQGGLAVMQGQVDGESMIIIMGIGNGATEATRFLQALGKQVSESPERN